MQLGMLAPVGAQKVALLVLALTLVDRTTSRSVLALWETIKRVVGILVQKDAGLYLRTYIIDRFKTGMKREDTLNKVRDFDFRQPNLSGRKNHSHPGNAALRGSATLQISQLCKLLQKTRFDVSISPREVRAGARGKRFYQTGKDLTVQAHYGTPGPDDIITMVDTDYYIEDLSVYAGHPLILYTLDPDGLTGKGPDSMWRFIDASTVVEDVSGSKPRTYTHSVRDWCHDTVYIGTQTSWWWPWGHTTLYDVERRRVSPGRSVIILMPAARISLPLWLVKKVLIRVEEPEFMKVTDDGEYLSGYFGKPGAVDFQLLRKGVPGLSHTTVPVDVMSALETKYQVATESKTGASLVVADTERLLAACGLELGASGIVHLTRCINRGPQNPEYNLSYDGGGPLKLGGDGKDTVELVAEPIVHPAMGPVRSENIEVDGMKNRIERQEDTKQPADFEKFAEEFVELAVPKRYVGTGAPVPDSVVEAKQNRPAQRARREQVKNDLSAPVGKMRVVAFMKVDRYAGAKHARFIQTVPTHHTTQGSTYTYGIKDLVTEHWHWCAVGDKPDMLAERLRAASLKAKGTEDRVLKGTDYSVMDRSHQLFHHKLVESVFLRYYNKRHHSVLGPMMRAEREVKARGMGFGTKVVSKGNKSGSPWTTIKNTIVSAFNEFMARRRRGESPEAAWEALGVYFGDDGVVDALVAPDVLVVAADCGMKCELEVDPPGKNSTVFLSRVYPDLAYSSSHPKMKRALAALPVDLKSHAGQLGARCLAVCQTNLHVPVLSDYALALLRTYRSANEDPVSADELERETLYKLEQGPYPAPQSKEEWDLLHFSVARDLGIEANELPGLVAKLRSANTPCEIAASRIDHLCEPSAVPDWAWLLGATTPQHARCAAGDA